MSLGVWGASWIPDFVGLCKTVSAAAGWFGEFDCVAWGVFVVGRVGLGFWAWCWEFVLCGVFSSA